MNVLCIFYQDDQRWTIEVDNSSKFKGIYLFGKPVIYGLGTKHGATLPESQEKTPVSVKKTRDYGGK